MMQVWYLTTVGEKRIKQGYRSLRSSDIVNTSVTTTSQLNQFYPLQSSRGMHMGYVLAKRGHFVIGHALLGFTNMDEASLCERIDVALNRRIKNGMDAEYCRVVFGSSDECPGLVIDRYLDVWVAMVYEPAWSLLIKSCADGLMTHFGMCALLIKGSSKNTETQLFGSIPKNMWVYEHGRAIWVDVLYGQKTGWYYDQRANRQELKKWIKSGRWADICCYHGGFGVAALAFGADHVTFVDRSAQALDGVRRSLATSGDNFETVCANADEWMLDAYAGDVQFDGVMCDPPCFLKGKKMTPYAKQAYQRWMGLCIALVRKEGMLVFSSCSSSVSLQHLSRWLMDMLKRAGRSGLIVYQGRADRDHPYHKVESEMDYLSCIFVQLDTVQ